MDLSEYSIKAEKVRTAKEAELHDEAERKKQEEATKREQELIALKNSALNIFDTIPAKCDEAASKGKNLFCLFHRITNGDYNCPVLPELKKLLDENGINYETKYHHDYESNSRCEFCTPEHFYWITINVTF